MFRSKKLLSLDNALLFGILANLAMPLQEAALSAQPSIGASHEPKPQANAILSADPGRPLGGLLQENPEGELVVDLALRDYLDYFLSHADLVGLDVMRNALQIDASNRLGATSQAQLNVLLEHYLNYKQAAQELKHEAPAQREPALQLQALQQTSGRLRELRREHLGAEIARVFFADEEAYGDYTLARMALMTRTDLDPAARKRALAELERQLPNSIQTGREQQREQQLRNHNARRLLREAQDADSLRQQLAEQHDAETVDRLLAEYHAERNLQQRYRAYRQQAEQLRATRLAQTDLQTRLSDLRQRMFRSDELLKVQAMEAGRYN